MKDFLAKKSTLLTLLFVALLLCKQSIYSNIRIRSQSVDAARELVGWTDKINLWCDWCDYDAFSITPEYTKSFDGNHIAKCLFGDAIIDDCEFPSIRSTQPVNCFDRSCGSFVVSGSLVPNRGVHDLVADYFGLPTDFQSIVTVCPEIENFIVDFNWYHGHSSKVRGLWFRVHAPLVFARWKLDLCENVLNPGVNGYNAGYFAPAAVPRSNLLSNFTAYLSGQAPTLNGGVVFQPLQNQLLVDPNCPNDQDFLCRGGQSILKKTALSDIQMALGWNFLQNDDYHVGAGLRVVAPTGTRNLNKYLFQPQIGNGHHWELGVMFTSHWTFWRNCDDTRSAGFFFDANITYLNSARQCRVFDLCGKGDNSKYMLAQKMGLPIENGLTGNPTVPPTGGSFTAPTAVFKNLFVPIANIAVQPVLVNIPVQIDAVALFNYTHCNHSWDFGYDFWMTSCEKIKECTYLNQKLFTNNNTYALKGGAQVFGFTSTTTPVPLSATNDSATINNFGTLTNSQPNQGIDNAQFAYSGGGAALFFDPANTNTVRTSIQPIFLDENDIDYAGTRTKGLSHKVFTHFSYTWTDRCYEPYLGIGAKVEFAEDNSNEGICPRPAIASAVSLTSPAIHSTTTVDCSTTCPNECVPCRSCAISEWGIWLKGGISF